MCCLHTAYTHRRDIILWMVLKIFSRWWNDFMFPEKSKWNYFNVGGDLILLWLFGEMKKSITSVKIFLWFRQVAWIHCRDIICELDVSNVVCVVYTLLHSASIHCRVISLRWLYVTVYTSCMYCMNPWLQSEWPSRKLIHKSL